MEKEGLMRSLKNLHEHNLDIDVLITDRHRQIAKYIREEHPDIQHRYDIWHVAKGNPYLFCSLNEDCTRGYCLMDQATTVDRVGPMKG